MVDRIERPESSLYKVLETDRAGDEGKGAQAESEDPQDKDHFKKRGKDLSKKIAVSSRKSSPLFGNRQMDTSPWVGAGRSAGTETTPSWTWRLKHTPLVALGILGVDHTPRWNMIGLYALGLTGLIGSLTLFIIFLYDKI